MKVKLIRILFMLLMFSISGCGHTDDTKTTTNEVSDMKQEKILNKDEKISNNDELTFSEIDSFYPEDIAVEIKSNQPGTIYYTLDGTDPDETQNVYEKAIELKAGKEVTATCIKAKAYYEDGTVSKTLVHTYFVGKNIKERFDTLVFSVTTDPYNLYDYEYGIFIEGKLRDDYIKEHPNAIIEPDDPANYNMRGRESEREVYLEIFEPDGKRIVEQKAGIRTYGGWSRARAQKSIKIYARKEYDEENNKLRYEFFPWKTTAGDGSALDSFKQLVLRNCGNDNGFGFIRDELFQTLAGQAGYSDYQAVRPAALYVNGDYRGLFWLHEVYCDEYFEDHYGDYSGSFEILEGGENFKDLEEDNGNAGFIDDYDKMQSYAKLDLTDNKNYEELCKLLDVENYLSYYALQIYIGNEDWPHNNYKTYRYYASEGEAYREAPFDGKWRNLLHDLDFSFNIYSRTDLNYNINTYVGSEGQIRNASPMFGQLMTRDDCKEIFITKTLDLINGAFAPTNLNRVLDEMNASRMNEQMNMYGKYLLEDWVRPEQLKDQIERIKTFAKERSTQILTNYQKHFSLGDIYTLAVQPAENCSVRINSFQTDTNFEGSYYSDYPVKISAVLPDEKDFNYWLVNDKKITEDILVLTSDNITEGKIIVSCVLK